MSAQEIIAELSKLRPEELRQVQAKMEELGAVASKSESSVWEVLREFAGKATGLPPDFATNHDHYLYLAAPRLRKSRDCGTPRTRARTNARISR